jgi:predicted nucleotidyltransferase
MNIEQNKPAILALFNKYSIEKASLFGSHAKNTAGKNSDVDFLIRFDKKLDYETYANNYFALLYELEALLGCEVDLTAEETLTNPYLLQSINQSKIELL